MKKVIEDVHAEWHGETGSVLLIAEDLDGSETVMAKFVPTSAPSFADASIPDDASDYGDYYNMALEEAHRQGMVIQGEE